MVSFALNPTSWLVQSVSQVGIELLEQLKKNSGEGVNILTYFSLGMYLNMGGNGSQRWVDLLVGENSLMVLASLENRRQGWGRGASLSPRVALYDAAFSGIACSGECDPTMADTPDVALL